MILLKNDILHTKDVNFEEFSRVLWLSEDNKYCITITMNVNKLIFNTKLISEIELLFNNGICKLYKEDLGLDKISDDDITPISIKMRDTAYEVIKYIFEQDDEIAIFSNSSLRSSIIKSANKRFNISISTLYKYVRIYLQGGRLKNSLIPNFKFCGAKGKEKNYTIKCGRKSYEEIVTGKKRGIVLDDYIRTIFKHSINRYYRKDDSRTLTQAYELMIQENFSDIKYGKKIILDEDKIPTFRQFKNYYYNNRDLETILRGRKGNKKFDSNMRALLSNSTIEAFGPGFRYQIDATIADVYLVSRFDGKSVIGRPILYLVVDVFSRLIVGFFIGLEGPSWNGAASAIYNCMEDKVEICKKYDIEIKDEQWPSKGLPEVLLADRGELVGTIGEKVVELLNITLENAPSYRGDAKGIVERSFRTVNDNIKHWTPGAVKKDYRERGERRYELDAKLNIDDFTKFILFSIIEKNNRSIESYPLTEEMIKDNVEPIPVDIWKWGMKNRAGCLHTVPEDVLKASLFRNGKAVITERGIRFQKKLYLTNLDNENDMFIKARVIGKKEVEILFDNRDISVIYMMDKDNSKLIPCFLKKENQLYYNKTYEEAIDYIFNRTIKNQILKYKDLGNKVMMNHEVEKIGIKAKKRNKSEVNIKGIKENRKAENFKLRKEQSLSKYTAQVTQENEAFEPIKAAENTNNSNQKNLEFIREFMKKERNII